MHHLPLFPKINIPVQNQYGSILRDPLTSAAHVAYMTLSVHALNRDFCQEWGTQLD